MSDWHITDDECLRLCRPIPATNPECYEFIQLNSYAGHVDGGPFYQVSRGTIHIHDDYTEDDLTEILNAFGYPNMDAFVAEYAAPEDLRFRKDSSIDREHSPCYMIDHYLLAEMAFRLDNQEYVDREFQSYNNAVSYIASVTDLDLYPYLEQKLMLVTELENGNEVNFITTQDEFLGPGKSIPRDKCTRIAHYPAAPSLYCFQKEANGPMYEARYISMSAPETAAAHLSNFFTGHWNAPFTGVWRNAPERTSLNAKLLISQLLKPVMEEACLPKDWKQPIRAIEWARQHPEYVQNLDNIFTALDLLKVQRHRFSVTQGEASVWCGDKKIVQYGDDQWLQQKSGRISNGFREKEGKLYGEIIGGWGSSTPDANFRRAALVQFTDRISSALLPTKTLEQKIQVAKKVRPKPISVSRQDPAQER